MFGAYFDDSKMGRKGGPPAVLAMACWVASREQWAEFIPRWSGLLASEKIEALHMTDLANKRRAFSDGWDAEREKSFLQRAHTIIRGTTDAGIGIGIDLKAYADVVPVAVNDWLGGGPHGFAAYVCLSLLAERARKQQYNEQIACFFESKSGYGREIFNVEQSIRKHPPVRDWLHPIRFKGFTFTTGTEAPQLQAADMLAYEGSKEWFNTYFAEPCVSRRKSLDNLLRLEGQDFGHFYDRARLQRFVNVSLALETEDYEPEPEPPLAERV